jgi:hypothetical protein
MMNPHSIQPVPIATLGGSMAEPMPQTLLQRQENGHKIDSTTGSSASLELGLRPLTISRHFRSQHVFAAY